MATHIGGMGDTPMENPKTQNVDNVSEDCVDFSYCWFNLEV